MAKITKEMRMPDELRIKVEKLTPYQRTYCEFRAKGLKQPDAAEKAGSTATSREHMGRGGYNIEQMDGAKEYIAWLQEARARASVVDEIEVIEKLREVYELAVMNGKFADANKAAELLGNAIGMFKQTSVKPEPVSQETNKPKNNTKAFKDESDEENVADRMSKLQKLLKDAST